MGWASQGAGWALALSFSDPGDERLQMFGWVLDQDLSGLRSNHLVSFPTDHSCSVPGWGEADHRNEERDSCDVPEKGAWGSGRLP